jgi:hypothetical protein
VAELAGCAAGAFEGAESAKAVFGSPLEQLNTGTVAINAIPIHFM